MAQSVTGSLTCCGELQKRERQAALFAVKIVTIQMHPIFERSDLLAWAGYSFAGLLVQSEAHLNSYRLEFMPASCLRWIVTLILIIPQQNAHS